MFVLDSQDVGPGTHVQVGEFLGLGGLLLGLGLQVYYDQVVVLVGDQGFQLLAVVEELHVSNMTPNFLKPDLPEKIILDPLPHKEAQPSKLIGQQHITGFMLLILLIVDFRDVREGAQPEPFREIPGPDGL